MALEEILPVYHCDLCDNSKSQYKDKKPDGWREIKVSTTSYYESWYFSHVCHECNPFDNDFKERVEGFTKKIWAKISPKKPIDRSEG